MDERFERLKVWARSLRRDVVALWLAAGDPRTPSLARLIAAGVAAYAFSPIDLIPDFIPVLGYLDELLLLPLGIAVVIRLIPPGLMAEFRARAATTLQQPISRIAAVVIAVIWLISGALLATWALRQVR